MSPRKHSEIFALYLSIIHLNFRTAHVHLPIWCCNSMHGCSAQHQYVASTALYSLPPALRENFIRPDWLFSICRVPVNCRYGALSDPRCFWTKRYGGTLVRSAFSSQLIRPPSIEKPHRQHLKILGHLGAPRNGSTLKVRTIFRVVWRIRGARFPQPIRDLQLRG